MSNCVPAPRCARRRESASLKTALGGAWSPARGIQPSRLAPERQRKGRNAGSGGNGGGGWEGRGGGGEGWWWWVLVVLVGGMILVVEGGDDEGGGGG